MTINSDDLTHSLRRLVADGSSEGRELLPALRDVVDACADLFDVTGCGIMLADDQDSLRYVTSSSNHGRLLERLEAETEQGPCTDAFFQVEEVVTADLREDPRWPRLGELVAQQPELRAVLGVPVRLGGIPVGTLDVFRATPHEWSDQECEALDRYADVIEVTITSALAAHTAGEQAAQLQYALDYRVVIERGVGFLMARDGLDATSAFNTLRSAARSSRSKIGQVAQLLLDTGRLPDGTG